MVKQRIADLRVAHKLALLCGTGLLTAGLVGGIALAQFGAVRHAQAELAAVQTVRTQLRYLDHRMSELKANGFHALTVDDASEIAGETAEDVETVAAAYDELRGVEEDPEILAVLEELEAANMSYAGFVQEFTERAVTDPLGARADAQSLVDENRAMDGIVERANGLADEHVVETQELFDHAISGARTMVAVVLAIGLALAVALSFAVSRMIANPLRRAVEVLERMAAGDLTARLPETSRDEVGQMAVALNTGLERTESTIRSIGENAMALASSSEELSAVSQQVGAASEETSAQAGAVSAAAEQVSGNVATVATGTEEMSASIREIAGSATEAARVASSAVSAASSANATVTKLGVSSAEISQVVKVITSIAEQTNLLALNATIEAARAGEAGKGFAVVANEVKDLAKETARATEEIGSRIAAIQGDATEAVTAIAEISSVIGQINDIQGTIASAVEEQTATTNEIGRNVAEAAAGSSEIAQNITGVAQAASEASGGAANTLVAATDLARMAEELARLVGLFTVGAERPPVRQAPPTGSSTSATPDQPMSRLDRTADLVGA